MSSQSASGSDSGRSTDSQEPIIRIGTTRAGKEVWEWNKEQGAVSRNGVSYARAHANGHRRKSVLGTKNVFFVEITTAGVVHMEQIENSEISKTDDDEEEERSAKERDTEAMEMVEDRKSVV